MLGLPSTTEVNRRLPKEAFYSHLKMTPALKAEFVGTIERIDVRNSLKPSTMNVVEGERVAEMLVLEVALKERKVPESALKAIAAANKHKLLFVCTFGHDACLVVMPKGLVVGQWQDLGELRLTPNTESMDRLWDSLASQIAYGDSGIERMCVEERFARDAKLRSLHEELDKLKARIRKEKQFVRKNALFAQKKELESQIAAFEEGR